VHKGLAYDEETAKELLLYLLELTMWERTGNIIKVEIVDLG